MGADALIVHDKNSQEPYHDYQYPETFVGVLPVLYDDHQGDVIYRVPRRFPGLAHVVEAARVQALRPIQPGTYWDDLRPYVETMEKGPDAPAYLQWEGPDRIRIHARLAPGHAILVQESYDPAWRAYVRGRPVRIEKDAMGFMLMEPPPGEPEMVVVFELPRENQVGYILFGVTLLALAILLLKKRRTSG
jgi:LPXTG-motif cell wall-anchored protein